MERRVTDIGMYVFTNMITKNKKLIIALGGIVALLLVGFGLYFYFKKGSLDQTGVFPGPATGLEQTPGEGEGETNVPFTPGSNKPLPRLYQLHKIPVSGVAFFEAGKDSTLTQTARYIERSVGHIYETSVSTYTEQRILNQTRSKNTEALWGNNGRTIALRSLGDGTEESILTTLIDITDLSKPTESRLPDSIPFMAMAEDGIGGLFYLENGYNLAVGSIATIQGKNATKVFRSSFTEWLPQFPNKNLVTLTTRPSAEVPGYLFFLNPTTKSLDKILSGIQGLTTLTNREGKIVVYSETVDKTPELSLYDPTKKSSKSLPFWTLPEKCTWGIKNTKVIYCAVPKNPASGTYPDSWYQGIVTFSDEIWKFDTETGLSTRLLSLEDPTTPRLDMQNLTISSDDAYILFMNKVSGAPWLFRIALEAPKPVVKQEASVVQAAIAPSIATTTPTKATSSIPTFNTPTQTTTPTTTTVGGELDGLKKIK